MALVQELAISEEERALWLNRCMFLIKVHRTKQCNKDVVKRVFDEWMSIATRLKKGGQMIDQKQAELKGDMLKTPHLVPLVHLYYFLIGMFNIYDGFMQSMFDNDLYERAYQKVKMECLGE